ncbi:MAG: hypothetical protein K2Q01_05270 [Rickettsiales bacterium]|nr:hypothetical protein [Rickettsiales bacterium]
MVESVQEVKAAVVQKVEQVQTAVVKAYDATVNTVIKPVMAMKVKSDVKEKIYDSVDASVDKAVAKKIQEKTAEAGASIESAIDLLGGAAMSGVKEAAKEAVPIPSDVAVSDTSVFIARQVAVQKDLAPSTSQIKKWSKAVAEVTSQTMTDGAYSSADDLRNQLLTKITATLESFMSTETGFKLDDKAIKEIAVKTSDGVAENFDKIPSSVRRSAGRAKAEQEANAPAPAPAPAAGRTAAAEPSRSNEMMLGNLSPTAVGRAQGNSMGVA